MAQYVNIKSSFEEGEEVISLPTDNNGCLLINTLNSFGFRGVDGLKFINPVTRRITGIEKDTTGTKFSPPAFGWGNEEFVVILRRQSAPVLEERVRANNGIE
uniref:TDP43_N domain-containing protein n=1 Tax=Meloidogyne hapla TaxID=6305 RepID=A0A1I8BWM0_MELHA